MLHSTSHWGRIWFLWNFCLALFHAAIRFSNSLCCTPLRTQEGSDFAAPASWPFNLDFWQFFFSPSNILIWLFSMSRSPLSSLSHCRRRGLHVPRPLPDEEKGSNWRNWPSYLVLMCLLSKWQQFLGWLSFVVACCWNGAMCIRIAAPEDAEMIW